MRIAFIGLGTMGGHMASNLQAAGHELVVHDARRAAADKHLQRGARWADSPRDAAREAELILTSLPGPKEVKLVALGEQGVGQGAPRGSIYADLSTSSPTLIRRIHKLLGERGIDVLDAPVSGGPMGAERATLQIMVGGDEAVFERARPALEAIGDKVSHIGEIGAGAVAKLAHNLLGYCTAQALAEVFTLGIKAGVKPEKLLEAIRGGAFGQGYALSYRLPEVVFKDDFDNPRFALALARKDVALANELAREHDVPMAMGALAEQALIEAMARGWGNKDSAAAMMLQEERAGVKIRGSQT
jgi:3-hydroxyisobutyrate dehydrogenase-like beta-hydroxyacid dehydrogenase